MDERTRTQLAELRSRWLAMRPEAQEGVLMLARLLSDDCNDTSGNDLSHLKAFSDNRVRRWQQRQNPEDDVSQPG